MNTIGRNAGMLAAVMAVAGTIMAGPAAAQLHIAAEARVTLLARAYNATGQQLFGQFAATPGNVVFSPYSVGTAVSMALSGARGDTASEMMRALSMRMATDAIDMANAEMLSILNGYDHSAAAPICPPLATVNGANCEMRPLDNNQCQFGLLLVGDRCVGPGTPPPSARFLAANALMLGKHGDLIAADYVAALKTKYAAEVFKEASLDAINGWVAQKTEGKIAKMLDRLDPNSVAVLLNAVYFKARWASVFDPKLTKDETFNLTRSQKADVPMMNQTTSFSLVSRGGYRAVRLNYQVPELGLVVVLPDDVEGAGAVAARLGANELADLFTALRDGQAKKPVALTLPRFKAEYRADLVAPFRQAGIQKAFDANDADFSGMTGRPATAGRLHIDQIVHRAVIEVAEESTEAAAATAVGVRSLAVPAPMPTPVSFRVDHPFLFYLVDDTTGAILFQGRIADPR
ncbi:MAG TPA: serpin family protein [Xanthobacteraceae bacterium]|nr:serpin family protein [Xanthobacteraceae bacterium]